MQLKGAVTLFAFQYYTLNQYISLKPNCILVCNNGLKVFFHSLLVRSTQFVRNSQFLFMYKNIPLTRSIHSETEFAISFQKKYAAKSILKVVFFYPMKVHENGN
jgi:hypothetical protein